MNEDELLKLIKETPEAFSEIFELYYKPIFGYVLRRTGEFDLTADITSETFLKAFININKFNYTGISIKVWLYRIATNEINLFYRSKKKNQSVFERLNLTYSTEFKSFIEFDRNVIEEEMSHYHQFNIVLHAVKVLPLKYQTAIALRYFENKSNKEICEILQMKEGTLKSLLSRGIEQLRNKCDFNLIN